MDNAPRWIRLAARLTKSLPAGRYRFAQWICRKPTAPFWARMHAGSGELLFSCDVRDSIARDVCFTGRYEPQESALVGELLDRGMTFVDVGANWGYFSMLAASTVGPSGRVVSLEPDPRLFEILRRNIRRNGLCQIDPLLVAAHERDGDVRLEGFQEDRGNWGVSRVVGHELATAPSADYSVRAKRIDDLMDERGMDRVDLLKMDIEGGELYALRGMERGLANHRYRRILLEVHPSYLETIESTVSDVLAMLIDRDYKGYRIDHSASANRRASYDKRPRGCDYLEHRTDSKVDSWPHYLWLAPGVDLPR